MPFACAISHGIDTMVVLVRVVRLESTMLVWLQCITSELLVRVWASLRVDINGVYVIGEVLCRSSHGVWPLYARHGPHTDLSDSIDRAQVRTITDDGARQVPPQNITAYHVIVDMEAVLLVVYVDCLSRLVELEFDVG